MVRISKKVTQLGKAVREEVGLSVTGRGKSDDGGSFRGRVACRAGHVLPVPSGQTARDSAHTSLTRRSSVG